MAPGHEEASDAKSGDARPAAAVAPRRLAIAVVTSDPEFLAAAVGAVRDAADGAVAVVADLPSPPAVSDANPLYVEAVARARRYLGREGKPLAFTVIQAATLDDAAAALAARADAGPLGVLWLDADGDAVAGAPGTTSDGIDARGACRRVETERTRGSKRGPPRWCARPIRCWFTGARRCGGPARTFFPTARWCG